MADSVRRGLLGAYRRIMRPLVRILIRNGVSFHEFSQVIQGVFVEAACDDFRPPDRPNTLARVCILTGLTREEVENQEKILASGDLEPKGHLSQVTKVLVGWHSDARFTGPYGLPIDLPYKDSHEPSFCELVASFAPDISPDVMLDELLRVNAIEKNYLGKFKVLMRAYIPDSLHVDGLERLGEVVQNFINTVETNMEKTRRGAGRFERVVYADDGLDPIKMSEFDTLLRRKGQQLLVELDNWLSSQDSDADDNRVSARVRTGVGIYHYIETDAESVDGSND